MLAVMDLPISKVYLQFKHINSNHELRRIQCVRHLIEQANCTPTVRLEKLLSDLSAPISQVFLSHVHSKRQTNVPYLFFGNTNTFSSSNWEWLSFLQSSLIPVPFERLI